MFSRKYPNDSGIAVPAEWKEDFIAVLSETFKDHLPSQFHLFDAYGEIHQDEIVIVSCLYDSKNLNNIPITCFISVDLDEKMKKEPKKVLNNMTDLSGLFFEECLKDSEFTDFEPNWQDTKFKNQKYFFKITRENILLSIEASKLLNDDNKIQ
ncbi:hypothetical protein N9B72_01120 [Bacteriovoracaceae bacterium]|jgi:hypothetical protein|nr:hypothetical protein [Bacteriovoracaceae bacterium]